MARASRAEPGALGGRWPGASQLPGAVLPRLGPERAAQLPRAIRAKPGGRAARTVRRRNPGAAGRAGDPCLLAAAWSQRIDPSPDQYRAVQLPAPTWPAAARALAARVRLPADDRATPGGRRHSLCRDRPIQPAIRRDHTLAAALGPA